MKVIEEEYMEISYCNNYVIMINTTMNNLLMCNIDRISN